MGRVKHKLREWNDRWIITPKLMYFTMNTTVYAFHLFRGPFIREYLGLTAEDVWLSGTLMGVASFPSITMWSTFSDALGRHKLVLSAITCGAVVCFELLLVRMENATGRMLYSMGMLMLYSGFLAGMQPLLDFKALELLSSKPGFSKEMYGRQRLWGTVAYSVVTMGSAITMEYGGGFWLLFLIMPAAAVIFLITLYFVALPDRPKPLLSAARRRYLEQQRAEKEEAAHATYSAHEQQKTAKDGVLIGMTQDAKLSTPQNALSTPQDALSNPQDALSNPQDALSTPQDALSNPHGATQTVNLDKENAAVSNDNPKTEGFGHRRSKSPWRTLLTDMNYMFFLFLVLMLGLSRAVMTTSLAVFWSGPLEMSKIEVAVAGGIFGMFLEVVIFFVAKHLAPIMGNYWMLVVAQLATVVRCWAYFFIPTGHKWYWLVYLIELLKGLSFGMAHSAAIKIANEAAPEGLEATAQALYNSAYVQLPTIIAGLGGRWVSKSFGPAAPKLMFLSTSVTSSLALALFFVKYSLEGKIRITPWRRG